MEENIYSILKLGVENGDPTVIGIIVALVVVILTIVIFIVKRSGRSKRYGVLLLGICDAGKTLIYSQLVHQAFVQTCTSIKVNTGEYVVPEKNKKLRVIDLPGHERLRGRLLEEYKSLARGLVFVIDSGTLQREIKEVAEGHLLVAFMEAAIGYLYTLLSDQTVSSNTPPVLILCNKQDLTLAKGAKVIRSQLEKEMNTLRVTRAAALKGVGDLANNNTYLGKRDKDFDFSDVKPLKIEFAECSALGNGKNSDGPEFDELYRWLARVA